MRTWIFLLLSLLCSNAWTQEPIRDTVLLSSPLPGSLDHRFVDPKTREPLGDVQLKVIPLGFARTPSERIQGGTKTFEIRENLLFGNRSSHECGAFAELWYAEPGAAHIREDGATFTGKSLAQDEIHIENVRSGAQEQKEKVAKFGQSQLMERAGAVHARISVNCSDAVKAPDKVTGDGSLLTRLWTQDLGLDTTRSARLEGCNWIWQLHSNYEEWTRSGTLNLKALSGNNYVGIGSWGAGGSSISKPVVRLGYLDGQDQKEFVSTVNPADGKTYTSVNDKPGYFETTFNNPDIARRFADAAVALSRSCKP